MCRFAPMKLRLLTFLFVLALPLCGQGQDVLAEYKAKYKQGMDATDSTFRQKRLAMPAEQIKALHQLEAKYQRAGDLTAMLEVQNERTRFILDPRGQSIPALQSPVDLAKLLQAYRKRYQDVAAEREKARGALTARYREALVRLKVNLTQQGNIAEAKDVMQVLETLPVPPPPPIAPPAAAAALPAASPAASTAEPVSGGGVPEGEAFTEWFEE